MTVERVVYFKDEDTDAEGRVIGPFGITEVDDESPLMGRPFDPNRKPDPWGTLKDAEALASEHELRLVQS